MEESVLFRSMAESLSTGEFNQFRDTLLETFNQRELLTKSIFHLLAYQNRNALQTEYTQNINQILKNIIYERDESDDNNNYDEDDNIDDINNINNSTSISDVPYPLIAECSSYLDLSEVINFQSSNRHIYISCTLNSYSITELTSFYGHNWDWYTFFKDNNFGCLQSRVRHLMRFNMIKHLSLTVPNILDITNKFENSENYVWKNINALRVSHGFVSDDVDIMKIKKYILESQTNLQYLSLDLYNIPNISDLLSFITTNKHLKFLEINSGGTILLTPENQLVQHPMVKAFDFNEKMNNLGGISMNDKLCIDDLVFFHSLLSKLFAQIQSYHIRSKDSSDDVESICRLFGMNYNLNNLKEICISLQKAEYETVHDDDCSDILSLFVLNQTFNESNLERINISLLNRGCREQFDDEEYLNCAQFIQHILETQKNLKYVSISGDNGTILNLLCNYFESNANNLSLQSIKFRFLNWSILRGNGHNDIREDIENGVFRLIHVMRKVVKGNFLIKFALPWHKTPYDEDAFDEINSIQCIQRIGNLDDNHYKVDKTDSMDKRLPNTYIVSNKNANFDGGYHEQWYMYCKECGEYW